MLSADMCRTVKSLGTVIEGKAAIVIKINIGGSRCLLMPDGDPLPRIY